MSSLKEQDPDVYAAIAGEAKREADGLELIPSENYVSAAVREANASVLTNKYAEGYPGRRYYGGQEYTDAVERLAIDRAKELFSVEYANVQPHSGAPANLAVYAALLEPGDTVLGMDLSHGGHLTHGHPVTFPAQVFRFVRYGMKDPDTGQIDYDQLRDIAKKEHPKIILAGFSAYSRELDYDQFVSIAREVGAIAVADIAHIAGLIAGGVLANPCAHGFDVLTTTTHKTLRGPRGGMILTREDGEIAKKIDKSVFPGLQGGPHMHTIAAKAVALGEARTDGFAQYARQVVANAQAMAQVCIDHDIRLIGGGTDNHMVLADVYGSLGISGKEAQTILDAVGITLNMNAIPDDTRSPRDPSGIRFGTPALTTRGFSEEECKIVAELMIQALQNKDTDAVQQEIKETITTMARNHPIPDSFVS